MSELGPPISCLSSPYPSVSLLDIHNTRSLTDVFLTTVQHKLAIDHAHDMAKSICA